MKVARNAKSVWAISDLHSDFKENMRWIKALIANKQLYNGGFLIVAGDVAVEIDVISETLCQLQTIFTGGVAYVPGNHDLWLRETEAKPSSNQNSLTKFAQIQTMCQHLGVSMMNPIKVKRLNVFIYIISSILETYVYKFTR